MAEGSSVTIHQNGVFSAWLYVVASTRGRESKHSGLKNKGSSFTFTFEDLQQQGFQDGDTCQVVAQIEASINNPHKCSDVFTLKQGGSNAVVYNLSGSVDIPHWKLQGGTQAEHHGAKGHEHHAK